MTWGCKIRNNKLDQQIEYSLSQGINFIDGPGRDVRSTAVSRQSQTEAIIGNWLARNPQRRQEVIIASKSQARLPCPRWPITGEAVIAAVDASLARLQTDYIDLYHPCIGQIERTPHLQAFPESYSIQ
ncbi:aldo/keto reductase [Vibrio lentus]|nr:aldo/keto reductase [Vibrio lentus]